MKISLNALKKYVKIDIPTPELLKLIGSRLVEIEGTEDLSQKYQGITIVKVVFCEKIEGTHLSLCRVFDGQTETQVVCGAPNVREGMLAVWLRPGCIVPETYGGENFQLGTRKLRGYESNGMLAAADELGFKGGSHDGIVEIDPDFAAPGDDFASKFDLNDIILDIENKSLTHRPDTFGLIGFAREVAGIMGQKFPEPKLFAEASSAAQRLSEMTTSSDCHLEITLPDAKICPAYTAAVLDFTSIKTRSPYLTPDDVFLYKADMRPISPIVDLTNIIMLETGQPLHAFDYDKFVSVGSTNSPKILVRLAERGEELALIDGKTVKCVPTDILITSNDAPVALAGAMGGANTEIDSTTSRIIIESATFSLYNLRKTQMEHGIFSEAITRFTKGQPASNCLPVLAEISERLGGHVLTFASQSAPVSSDTPSAIPITISSINQLLGTAYDQQIITTTLENVGFGVTPKDTDTLEITTPSWRTDIHIKEDIIEEVGRLLGYDNIPLDFPVRKFIGSHVDDIFSLKIRLRHLLSEKTCAHEVLTYSFVSGTIYEKCHLKTDNLYRITNSISPELQYFRNSIIPSLLDKIRDNEKSGHEDFTIFEMNQVFDKSQGLTDEQVPVSHTQLAIATLGDFYKLKSLVSKLFSELGIDSTVAPTEQALPYFEPLHSADISISGTKIATIGEINSSVQKSLKISSTVSVFEIDLEVLLAHISAKKHSLNFSKFPSVTRDITIATTSSVDFVTICDIVEKSLSEEEITYRLTPTSIYKKSNSDTSKNTTFKITINHPEKTLTSGEINDIMEKVSANLSEIDAKII